MLGLAPSEHLSQTKTPIMFRQLFETGVIERPIWSLMLINGQEGVLSVGGTSAPAVQLVQKQTTNELDNLGALERGEALGEVDIPILKRGLRSPEKNMVKSREVDWENGWKWSKVQGAEGWWQILMQGVWADGSKVLKNQPAVIDVRSLLSHYTGLWTQSLEYYAGSALDASTILQRFSARSLTELPAEHSLHSRPAPRSKSLLRLHLRLSPAPSAALELLHVPLPQSACAAL